MLLFTTTISYYMNPKVAFFFNDNSQWQSAYALLRSILQECPLTEELKWGTPCYTYNNSNVVLIHGFKDYCALLFFKGALMPDPQGILIQQSANVQSARQMRFTSAQQIKDMQASIKAYILEAINVEKSGQKVSLKKTEEYTIPEEFQAILNTDKHLATAFKALTPGRQRAYLLHFAAPKQSKTRTARIEKCIPAILDGKGLND